MHDGTCVDTIDCPARSLPPQPPPPSPTPPRQPIFSPPASLPTCTVEQETQNQEYCYNIEFGDAVCAFDSGIHCPERCGLCKRRFATSDQSASVHVHVYVDQKIHTFKPMQFRQKFADAVAISVNSVEMTLTAGSTIADLKIATISGSYSDANALNARIASRIPDAASASTTLGVPVLSITSTVVQASPSAPPSQKMPPPLSPPLPPLPSPPLTSPPPNSKKSNLVEIVLVCVAAALILAVALCVCMKPADTSRRTSLSTPLAKAPVIIYAESAFSSDIAEYAKLK